MLVQLEVSVGEDIVNDEYLYNEVHPPKNVAKSAFARPKGPAKKGPRRITKPTTDEWGICVEYYINILFLRIFINNNDFDGLENNLYYCVNKLLSCIILTNI